MSAYLVLLHVFTNVATNCNAPETFVNVGYQASRSGIALGSTERSLFPFPMGIIMYVQRILVITSDDYQNLLLVLHRAFFGEFVMSVKKKYKYPVLLCIWRKYIYNIFLVTLKEHCKSLRFWYIVTDSIVSTRKVKRIAQVLKLRRCDFL